MVVTKECYGVMKIAHKMGQGNVGASAPLVRECLWRFQHERDARAYIYFWGTYSLGGAAPSPKKYCSICLTMTSWSSRRAGLRRYSLSNILQNSVHPLHASWDTL